MFTDNVRKTKINEEVLQMNTNYEEKSNRVLHWKCRDEVYKNGELIDVIEGENLVVDKCSVLIAGLLGLKSAQTPSGIQYWAIGSGSASWDDLWGSATPPTPAANTTQLVAEIYRKAITASNIKFVDGSGNEVADTNPTNRIKITVTISEAEGNGNWREFGLFGGNATASANSGFMLNHKMHRVLSKTSEISVTRSIILEF
jgi:hypothetical protein